MRYASSAFPGLFAALLEAVSTILSGEAVARAPCVKSGAVKRVRLCVVRCALCAVALLLLFSGPRSHVLHLGRCWAFLPLSRFSALNRYACLFAALTRPVKQLCGYRLNKIERLGEPESFGMLSAPPSLYFSISRFFIGV